MRRTLILAMALALSGISPAAEAAGDPEAGSRKAEPCNACHGSNGLSINDLWPNLAGQKLGYLVKQIKSFRDGTRKDPIMATFAQPLSDQDIEDIAAHFSRLPAAPPPAERPKLH